MKVNSLEIFIFVRYVPSHFIKKVEHKEYFIVRSLVEYIRYLISHLINHVERQKYNGNV